MTFDPRTVFFAAVTLYAVVFAMLRAGRRARPSTTSPGAAMRSGA